jgi:hypothetical protein
VAATAPDLIAGVIELALCTRKQLVDLGRLLQVIATGTGNPTPQP